jgi:hypothetical protein
MSPRARDDIATVFFQYPVPSGANFQEVAEAMDPVNEARECNS